MKNALLILGFCFPLFLIGQGVDSVALKRVDSLMQVSRALVDKGDFDKALVILSSAEKITLEKLGSESASYGSICHSYGRIHLSKGEFTAAEKWFLEAIRIRGKELGEENPSYASSLNNLAIVYLQMGKPKLTEPLFLKVRAIREKTNGKEHPDYLSILNNLAYLYNALGEYDKQESFLLEVRAILEKMFGKENADYGQNSGFLGNVYANLGNYEKAEQLLLEAKAICEKNFPKEHPSFAVSLNDLGVLYWRMGNYEKAELLYLEAKSIREKVFGKTDPAYAESLNNLAGLYSEMGNYEKAEPLYIEAKTIREKTLGKEDPDYAWSLVNLAILYDDMGNYEKAEPLYLEAKAIREKILGKEHPDYANSINNLAILYSKMRNYENAEPLYLESIASAKKRLGSEHPIYTSYLNNLATLYKDFGKYEKAEPLLLEVKATREKTLGKMNPKYASILDNLAHFYWSARNLKAAAEYVFKANQAQKELLIQSSRYLSEQELSLYSNMFVDGANRFFSFAQLQKGNAASCYDNSLFYKGFLLNAVSQVSKNALSDAVSAEKYNTFKSINSRLAAEYSKPLAERQNVPDLEEKANTLEKDLTRTVAGFGAALRQVNWQEVQQKLKPNEAAIEFLHYQFANPNPTDSTMYAALVLRPGMKQPVFIPLFEAKQLDTLLKAQGKTRPEYINQLYALGNPKKSLYQLIWKPLEQELVGASTVYYSPSGLLHRLNLNAIPVLTPTLAQNKNQTLADRYQLIELGSTRQLVMAAPKTIVDTTNAKNTMAAQLYGSIQYEIDSSATKVAYADLSKNTSTAPRGIDFGLADSTLRGGKWTYLKWTEVEINTLELILTDVGLKTDVHKAYAATEESFKRIGADKPSPRIVHLATHGFFFPDPKLKTKNESVSNGTNDPVFKISDHPMIRSGLILSGGNHAWQTGKPFRPGFEDGILTAYEISQMNLSNTELVVLSACETGLGDIQGNEGVYGLQRAFKIAGVKYLVMSLWQVPDFHTQELMTTFYSKWLEDKMSIPDAFRAAQKVMKDKFKEPFYWAGFILVE